MPRKTKEIDRIEAVFKLILGLLVLLTLGTGSLKTFPGRFMALLIAAVILAVLGLIAFFVVRKMRRAAASAALSLSNGQTPAVTLAASASTSEPAPSWASSTVTASLSEIDWYQFEKFCATLLEREGYTVERKGGAQPDGGVDLIATRPAHEGGEGERVLVQCKHWRTWVVQEKTVREMLGSMTHFQATRGAIYTLKGWTKPAADFAAQHGITLADASDLAQRSLERLKVSQLNALLNPREHHCPKCETVMVWRTGNFTPFWGCPRYPTCRGKLNHSGAR